MVRMRDNSQDTGPQNVVAISASEPTNLFNGNLSRYENNRKNLERKHTFIKISTCCRKLVTKYTQASAKRYLRNVKLGIWVTYKYPYPILLIDSAPEVKTSNTPGYDSWKKILWLAISFHCLWPNSNCCLRKSIFPDSFLLRTIAPRKSLSKLSYEPAAVLLWLCMPGPHRRW